MPTAAPGRGAVYTEIKFLNYLYISGLPGHNRDTFLHGPAQCQATLLN